MFRFRRRRRRPDGERQSHLIEHLEPRTLLAAATQFTFTLDGSYSTSAGVFNSGGTLVRTLWSAVRYTQGSHTATWDGNNDDGTAAPSGAAYTVKVLTDNMQYLWQGAIGNSSDFNVGSHEWVGLDFLNDMSISGTHAYASPGYEEGPSGMRSFNTSAPNTPSSTVPGDYNVIWGLVATDGNRFYMANIWDGFDHNGSTFVVARNVSDNSVATFTSGSTVNTSAGTISYTNAIDVSQFTGTYNSSTVATFVATQVSTGLAVQATGNILAVSHGALNQVRLFDKTTGASDGTISITAPVKVGFAPNGDLWVTSGTTVQRFVAATLGTTNTPVTTISGFSSALAVSVNPSNNDIVLVADGGSSQQIKAYTSTGTSLWTYGTAGGYTTGPAVTNSKFWFTNYAASIRYPVAPLQPQAFLAFQSDGSFWVSDGGNARALQFDASRNYIGQIAYISALYTIEVDPNNASRVFAHWLEYKVDYSKPLTRGDPSSAAGNKSWTLVNNWAGGIDRSVFTGISSVLTLSAGGNTFTYAITSSTASSSYWTMVKLPASGPLVAVTTGSFPVPAGNGQPHGSLAPNGDQRWSTTSGGVETIFSRPLTSIDASGNLTFSSTLTTLATVPAGINDPDTTGGTNLNPVSYPVTSSNIVVTYNATNNVSAGSYHVGGTALGGTAYKFKTNKAAALIYPDGHGSYPTQNSYGGHSGTAVYTEGRNIIANYDGQDGTFSNQFFHYNDDGLLIGQFGTTLYGINNNMASAWGATTNYLSVQIARASNGVLYVFTGDEAYHSGINTWEIVGDKQVREFSATGTDGSNLTLTAPTTGTGLQGDYYTDSGSTHFATPSYSNTDTAINFTFPSSSVPAVPQSGFSARWQGQVLTTTTAGLYTFTTQSAGGIRLWVDGQLLIDNWTTHSLTTNSATITLSASTSYNIRLEYFNPLATAGSLNLMWTPPGGSQAILPTANLFQARGQQPVGQNTGIPIASINDGDLSTIVAVNYDTGGAEDGYHVPGGGSVLIQSESDGSKSIGGAQAGESLKYDVNVVSGGLYNLWIYAANGNATTGYLHVEDMYGNNLTGTIPIAPTGGWHVPNYQTFLGTLTLQPGEQWVKLVFDTTAGYNVESVTLSRPTSPFGGIAPALPIVGAVIIEAENFDVGLGDLGNGQGISYFDTTDNNNGTNPGYRPTEGEYISFNTLASGGNYVRNLLTAEFLKYTIGVPAGGGTYDVGLPISITPTGIVDTMHIEDEVGRNLSGPITIPSTASAFMTMSAKITLTGGVHVLKLMVDLATVNTNLDCLILIRQLSNLATGGTAKASTGNGANGFDGNSSTVWQTTATTGTLQYQFSGASTAVITQYKITSAYNIASFPGQAPLNWQFQGSNGGGTWTTLDTQTGVADILNSDTRTYTIANGTAYTYYRINVTANNGDPSALEIGDLQLLPKALNVTGGTYNCAAPVAGNGIVPLYLGALSISSGANVVLGTAAAPSDRTVLLLDTLSNAGGGTTWTGTLDLGGNDLMLHSTASTTVSVLSSISQQLQAGYNGGLWNGKGISSSAAASDTRHLTAIGMMPNGSDSAFDNQTATTTDILLKHTYYGDANLDGKVDGSDYSRIDSGYLTKATGWFNGDFNYDGTINGSDYTLIDNAFNTQGAVLAATIAPAADPAAELAVPLKTFSPSPAIFSTNSAGLFSSLPLIQRSIQAMKSPAGQWSTDRNGRVPNILCTWPVLTGSSSAGKALKVDAWSLSREIYGDAFSIVSVTL